MALVNTLIVEDNEFSMQQLLDEDWHPEHYAWITQRFAGGISETQFRSLATQWQAAIAAADDQGERKAC